MTKIRVGIIGLGVGEEHIAGYRRHPACEVIALCDFDDKKRSAAQTKYPEIKIVKDADDILKDSDINLVSVASYDNYHYEQIIEAILNDKHIFVEKPLCLYEKEAVRIRSLLRKKPRLKMSSNLILRMSPRFRSLKQMIDSGKMGQLYYVEGDYNYGRLKKITDGWRGKIDYYSVVYGGGIHIVDLLLWLTGERVIEVAAYGNNISTKGTKFRYHDMVVCILKFESGMVGKISANFGCIFPHFHCLSIYGTGATFVNGLESGLFFEAGDNAVQTRNLSTAYPGVNKGDLIYNFVDSILNGSPAEVTIEDVFKTMSVCFAIEKATQKSHFIKVNYI